MTSIFGRIKNFLGSAADEAREQFRQIRPYIPERPIETLRRQTQEYLPRFSSFDPQKQIRQSTQNVYSRISQEADDLFSPLQSRVQANLKRQNIQTPQDFARSVFDPNRFTGFVNKATSSTFGDRAGRVISYPTRLVGGDILTGLQAPFTNKSRKQKAVDMARGVLSPATLFNPARYALGGTIGATGQAISNAQQGRPLTYNLEEGVRSGVESAWMLTATNRITDKLIGSFAPKLLSQNYGNAFKLARNLTGEARNKALQLGAKRTFQRMIAEIPAEAVAFGGWDSLKNDKKFVDAVYDQIPATVIGNLLFAGASSAGNTGQVLFEQPVQTFKNELVKAMRRVVTDPEFQRGSIDFREIKRAISPSLSNRGRGSFTNIRSLDNPLLAKSKTPSLDEFNKAFDEADDFFIRSQKDAPFKPGGVDVKYSLEADSWKRRLVGKLNPAANSPKEVQDALNMWRRKILVGNQDASTLARKFKHIPEDKGLDFIKYIQDPTAENAAKYKIDLNEYGETLKELRTTYDSLREEGVKAGLDIRYLDNYLNQVWKESPDEIAKKMRGLGRSPSFTQEKEIPSYEVGLKMKDKNGKPLLTPKFTHPAQLVAHYKQSLERAIAGRHLIEGLEQSGVVQPAGVAPLGWKPIDAPLVRELDGMKAPRDVADALSNLFKQQEDSLAKPFSQLSRYMQDVTLSGGVLTLNAFSLGNMMKEFTAGRITSPIKAFITSFSNTKSQAYFENNAPLMREMASEGIPMYTSYDYRNGYKNLVESQTLKGVLGKKWNDFINVPTFQRFLPSLQVEFYKDALANGMTQREAAQATKNFYGIADAFTRSDATEDVLSSVFFAPKFRESMIGFWIQNVKAISPAHFKDATFQANRKFLGGVVITYALYNLLNKATTGHFMWENKPGKEFSVEIPRPDGRSWFIPMLPSIGTLPRRAVEMTSALASGDVREATQKAGSFLSQPISLGSQLLSNRTFYGGPIYEEEDSVIGKITKLVGYGAEQSSHPFIGEPLAVAQGRKTPVEAFLGMLELPVYPSKGTPSDTIAAAQDFKKDQQQASKQERETGKKIYSQLAELNTPQERKALLYKLKSEGKLTDAVISEIKRNTTQETRKTEGDFTQAVRMIQTNEQKAVFIRSYLQDKTREERIRLLKELNTSDILTDDLVKKIKNPSLSAQIPR